MHMHMYPGRNKKSLKTTFGSTAFDLLLLGTWLVKYTLVSSGSLFLSRVEYLS